MSFGVLPGIYGTIWNTVLSSLVYVKANIDENDPSNALPLLTALNSTCKNALNCITGYQTYQASVLDYDYLAQFQSLFVTVNSTDLTYIDNRLTAIKNFSADLSSFATVTINDDLTVLSDGTEVISSNDLVSIWATAAYETEPTGLTASNFATMAQAAADAWGNALTDMATQGVPQNGTLILAMTQMQNCSQVSATEVTNISSLAGDIPTAWNQLVSFPSIMRSLSLLINDPTSDLSQKLSVLRVVLIQTIQKINESLVTMQAKLPSNVALATVAAGQTLMDVAARNLGDYERWQDIATLNKLTPPYIGSGQDQVQVGQSLLMPTSSTVPDTVNTNAPSYTANYLGTDIYYGPTGEDMLPWTGDFLTITGYDNLSLSLGRRLKTALGNLIFHSDYGSRIPPEVGQIQGPDTASHIEAYAQSALTSDPRVDSVVNAAVNLGANGTVTYKGTVKPNGYGVSTIDINEVISV